MALAFSIAATRYFFRRRGPAVSIGFGAIFWAAVLAAAAATGRGRPSWASVAAAGGCALATVGYAVYLAVGRKDLRLAPRDRAEPPPATRRCSSCGLEIDSRLARCPVCGGERPEE